MPIETLVEIIQKYQRGYNSEEKTKKIAEGTNTISKTKNGIRSGTKNMQLLCLQSSEDYKIPSKFIDASCQANDDYLRKKSLRKVSHFYA